MTKDLDDLAQAIHDAKEAYWNALPKSTVAAIEERTGDTEAWDAWLCFNDMFYWNAGNLHHVAWVEKTSLNGSFAIWGYDDNGNELHLTTTNGDAEIGIHARA